MRISESKKRYYKRVGSLLKGKPNLKHFNTDKQAFSSYATMHKENNKILGEFRALYEKLAIEHPEYDAKKISGYYSANTSNSMGINLSDWQPCDYADSVEKYLEVVVTREKAKQGCNYEIYQKLLARCRRDLPGFRNLPFSAVDYNFMVSVAYIFARGTGYTGITKAFRAFLGKAARDANVDFRLSQIGDFRFSDYNPDKNTAKDRQPEVLSQEQLRAFLNMDIHYLTPSYTDRFTFGLYYDFCVFMLHTFFSPCDVIKLKAKDITKRGTIVTRRKKTHRMVEVPVTPVMREIIDKYRGKSKDGYVFPIQYKDSDSGHSTKDYVSARGRINIMEYEGKVYYSFDGIPLIPEDALNGSITEIVLASRKVYVEATVNMEGGNGDA